MKPTYHVEPMLDRDQNLKVIIANRVKGTYEVVELNSLPEFIGKEEAEHTTGFVVEHISDWIYPSEFHPKQCLGYESGREVFSVLDGDYLDRIRRAANRISNYISTHLYMIGDYDMELVLGFIISTYFMDMFDYAPRLLIRGATNSGKSTLLDILAELCYRGDITGNTTEAALFRNISNNDVTPLLDEFQDYPSEVRNGIKKVLKNGNTRGRSVQRVEKMGNNSMKTVSYDVFAPIAFINQAGGKTIPEEVINRSISITMFAQPDIDIPMDQDHEELREIRDELYTIRTMWIAEPDRIPYQDIHKEAVYELQRREGIRIDDRAYHFSNRCRDIMGTMYTVAKMVGIEEPIVKAFGEIQEYVFDEEKDSNLGRTFMSILKRAEYYVGENPLFTKITDALTNITTSEVADEYRQMLVQEGELSPNEKFATRIVTNMIKDMGFALIRDRSTNKSLFAPRGLESCFQFNLMKYGSDDAIEKYASDKLKTTLNNRKSGVLLPAPPIEQPNNLTTKRGV